MLALIMWLIVTSVSWRQYMRLLDEQWTWSTWKAREAGQESHVTHIMQGNAQVATTQMIAQQRTWGTCLPCPVGTNHTPITGNIHKGESGAQKGNSFFQQTSKGRKTILNVCHLGNELVARRECKCKAANCSESVLSGFWLHASQTEHNGTEEVIWADRGTAKT